MASTEKKRPVVDDDDDLDDLDDIAAQFAKPPPVKKAPAPQQSQGATQGAASSTSTTDIVPDIDDISEDFVKQLAMGMESLMSELGVSGESGGDDARERQTAWEKLLVQDLENMSIDPLKSADTSGSKETKGDAGAGAASEPAFQQSIQEMMDRLRQSESDIKSEESAAASGASTDPLEALLGKLGSSADGTDNDEELQGMLEAMMQQLMSKEILYEPLKELNDKFPDYIKEHADTLSTEDRTRYENQLLCSSKIIAIFENSSYSDDNQEQGLEVVKLMNEMQNYGSPPNEIIGPLPPGLNFGADGAPDLENCVIA